MGAGALRVGEADHRLGAGEVVIEQLRLALEEEITLRIAYQRRTAYLLRHSTSQIVVERRGDVGARVETPKTYIPWVMAQRAVGEAFITSASVWSRADA